MELAQVVTVVGDVKYKIVKLLCNFGFEPHQNSLSKVHEISTALFLCQNYHHKLHISPEC